jgi:hypothetical protein
MFPCAMAGAKVLNVCFPTKKIGDERWEMVPCAFSFVIHKASERETTKGMRREVYLLL